MRRVPARKVSALLAAAALVTIGLTGCTAASASTSCVQPGDASKLVHASGDFGSPSGSFPKPLRSGTLQKTVIHQGTGSTISDGQMVVAHLAYYNGATGKPLSDPGTAWLTAGGSTIATGLQKAISCNAVGSRVSITGTVKQIYGKQTPTGAPDNLTMVFVVDITKAYPSRADGAPRPAQPGMPTVVLAPNGQPGITIPSHDAPTKVSAAVLKQGSGATVKRVDNTHGVLVNYTAVAWSTPDTVASSSWSDGAPVIWPDTSGQGTAVPAAVLKQLVGKNVGSQVVVVTPGNNATAYVIDILGIVK